MSFAVNFAKCQYLFFLFVFVLIINYKFTVLREKLQVDRFLITIVRFWWLLILFRWLKLNALICFIATFFSMHVLFEIFLYKFTNKLMISTRFINTILLLQFYLKMNSQMRPVNLLKSTTILLDFLKSVFFCASFFTRFHFDCLARKKN